MSALDNWQEEKQSAWLYRVMAEAETDAVKRELFSALGNAAEWQAEIWRKQFSSPSAPAPVFQPSLRARVVAWLIRALGARAIRPVLAAIKVRGISVYDAALANPGHVMPTAVAEVGRRHRGVGSGGNLRAAVFGVNDGLVSNTSLIMGVAGATHETAFILTSGVAGLLAGALSMAAGEYISMRSQREMYENQIALEREELAQYPEEEAEELALIYNARGMDMEEARAIARKMIAEPEYGLNVLAREELGLNPDDLGSPWGAAIFSFLAFTGGALIPLIPFLLGLNTAVTVAAVLAGISLFGVGAALSLFTGRAALASGLRMVLIGGGAGLVTYALGTALG
ncbi:MAG: VIT1/CCC1 transporter family protein [Sulfuricaulis sp.]